MNPTRSGAGSSDRLPLALAPDVVGGSPYRDGNVTDESLEVGGMRSIAPRLMNYPHRYFAALQKHWLAILIGGATGLYVAFGACLGLMIYAVSSTNREPDELLAFAMQAILMVGMVGGGFLGYVRRRR